MSQQIQQNVNLFFVIDVNINFFSYQKGSKEIEKLWLIIADMVGTQFTLNANKLHCYPDFNAQEKPTKFMQKPETCPRGEFLIRLL